MLGIPFLGGNFKINYFMKTIHLFLTVLFIAVQTANAQDKTESIDDTQEHIQFLEDFYVEYLSGPDVPKHEKEMSILRKYCTAELVDKIIEMWRNRKLDYDPFVFAQDVPSIILNHIKIEKPREEKNVYMMSYPHDFHVEVELKKITLKVINTPEGCKISNIISNYDKEKGLHFPLGEQHR